MFSIELIWILDFKYILLLYLFHTQVTSMRVDRTHQSRLISQPVIAQDFREAHYRSQNTHNMCVFCD